MQVKDKFQWVVDIIATALVLLFSYAAVSKIVDYHQFTEQLNDAPLLRPLSSVLTWMIPAAELYITILLLVPAWRHAGMVHALVIMLLFTGYVAMMLMFFETLPCSCGGVFEKMSWAQHLVFNMIFSLLAFLGVLRCRSKNIYAR